MRTFAFDDEVHALTGNKPFPWMQTLYHEWMVKGEFPSSCNIPTGLGKTSVIAVWLVALANHPDKLPRRLVYVVNRRTVVDQTTTEVEKLRARLRTAGLFEALERLCAMPPRHEESPLAISTLRGQFADNREWSADPARPAVIVGTVDMIGSRLLFSGYGLGFKSRPLHAGFLGQDVLLVHDEAHLEPAFQELVVRIQKEQHECERTESLPWPKLRVMQLTATSRGGGTVVTLSDRDRAEPEVRKRIGAEKTIRPHENKDDKKLAEEITGLALKHKDSNRAVLVFARRVDEVEKIVAKLGQEKQKVQQLTGTLRGLERDRMADPRKAEACRIFARFLKPPKPDAGEDERWKIEPQSGTVYLVCTSAGEVGVNISADHLVCDLSTFDSMAQRFGRVNRFGDRDDTCIDVIYPKEFEDNDLGTRLKRTLELLRLLNDDGSPAALSTLSERTDLPCKVVDAFAPPPPILPATDILFDAWALTSVCKQLTGHVELPGRPPVAEYLHGVEDEKQQETHVAWRQEVDYFHRGPVTEKQIGELLDEFPLRPHELLRDVTWRVQDELAKLADGQDGKPVWVIDPDDSVRLLTLGRLAAKDNKKKYVENLIGRTVVLPPSAGGLTATGTLSGQEPHVPERQYDVASRVLLASGYPLMRLVSSLDEGVLTYKLIAPVVSLPDEFQFEIDGDAKQVEERRHLRDDFAALAPMRVAYRLDLHDEEESSGKAEYLVLKPESRKRVAKHEAAWPSLDAHLAGVAGVAEAICTRLKLPPDIHNAVTLAAAWHDLGKDRAVWQRGAGNTRGAKPVAKTLHGRPPENLNGFRHELASMVDVCSDPASSAKFREQSGACQELLLHLIAAHHGRARPHFPDDEATDPERSDAAAASVASATPARFAKLQRQYGRWGLAYLESLLRAADAIDSKRIEDTPIGGSEPGTWPRPGPVFVWPEQTPPTPSIRVAVDPTNPGQFFACCGLLELADRLWPGGVWGAFSRAADEFLIIRDTNRGNDDATELLDCIAQTPLPSSMTNLQTTRLKQLKNLKKKLRTPAIEAETRELNELWERERICFTMPNPVWLDWWSDVAAGGSRFKTWAGKQFISDLVRGMQASLRSASWKAVPPARWLTESTSDGNLPFYFDAAIGGCSSSIDVGFSLDALDMRSQTRPLLELAAFVGLQRFRPSADRRTETFAYTTWTDPLPPILAAIACGGVLSQPSSRAFGFRLLYRTKYLKSFLPASPLSAGA